MVGKSWEIKLDEDFQGPKGLYAQVLSGVDPLGIAEGSWKLEASREMLGAGRALDGLPFGLGKLTEAIFNVMECDESALRALFRVFRGLYRSKYISTPSIPHHRGNLTLHRRITMVHKAMLCIERSPSLAGININPRALTIRHFAPPPDKHRACPATAIVRMRSEHVQIYPISILLRTSYTMDQTRTEVLTVPVEPLTLLFHSPEESVAIGTRLLSVPRRKARPALAGHAEIPFRVGGYPRTACLLAAGINHFQVFLVGLGVHVGRVGVTEPLAHRGGVRHHVAHHWVIEHGEP